MEKSSEAGILKANYELGKLYYKGIGCEQNEIAAKKIFNLAKINEFNKSDQFLAKQIQLRKSLSNVPNDTKEKFKHFKQLADQNVPEAMYKCGLMFLNGEGIEKSEDETIRYFKMAAKKEHQESMIKCGYILK